MTVLVGIDVWYMLAHVSVSHRIKGMASCSDINKAVWSGFYLYLLAKFGQ